MAEIRTLKLNLLADTQNFAKGLANARGHTKTFAGRLGAYTRQAAKGFAMLATAAVGAAAVMGKAMVDAAIEDEKSQAQLAQSMRNTIGATKDQIKASESWISVQQKAYGISDTKLRPAFANLLRVTENVAEAQKLTNLAMDIAAAKGLDLETVSMALAKAHEGNLGALKRLGIPLDENIIKTKDFTAAAQAATDLFGGAAQANTETLAGKMAIMNEAIGELQESFGQYLIPKLTDFVNFVTTRVIPVIEEIGRGIAGDDNRALSNKVRALARDMDDPSDAYSLGRSIARLAESFGKLFTSITEGADGKGGASTLDKIADSLNKIAKAIDAITGAYNRATGWWQALGRLGSGQRFTVPSPQELGWWGSPDGKRAAGGFVRKGGSYLVGEHGAEIVTMGSNGSVSRAGSMGTTIILNGIVDAESARRSIERIVQQSGRRSGTVNWTGAF